jgi:chaperonin GroES
MKLVPIKSKIILKMVEKEKSTESGIVLLSGDPNAPTEGEVIAIAEDIDCVKVGDHVLVNWNQAVRTKVDNEQFFIVKEDAIIAVFE